MKIVFDIKDIFANVPMNITSIIVLGEVYAYVYNEFATCKVTDFILDWHILKKGLEQSSVAVIYL
jgi:thymidylate synthase